jgi:hypothetical protein
MLSTIATVALAGLASASLTTRQAGLSNCGQPDSSQCQEAQDTYISAICSPNNASGAYDMNAPCNQVLVLTSECIYGSQGLVAIISEGNKGPAGIGSENAVPFSNDTQRDCICESHFFDALSGCNDCWRGHGASFDLYLPVTAITSVSSSYCAVSNSPTLGFGDMLYGYVTQSPSTTTTASNSAVSTFSDAIGNDTAVSKYFTPSVTGTAAWSVAQATQSTQNTASASLATSSGQIVPTAVSSGLAMGRLGRADWIVMAAVAGLAAVA